MPSGGTGGPSILVIITPWSFDMVVLPVDKLFHKIEVGVVITIVIVRCMGLRKILPDLVGRHHRPCYTCVNLP